MPYRNLLLIRPKDQSVAFLAKLSAGAQTRYHTIISPVFRIERSQFAVPTAPPQAILFTSANGVTAWADVVSDRSAPAFCVGASTTATARSRGFTAYNANGTASDLLQLVVKNTDPAVGPIYYVSGQNTAMDLAQALAKHGYSAVRIIAYTQTLCPLSPAAHQLLAQESVIIPIFSPNTAQAFCDQTQGEQLKMPRFVCISQNAAEPLTNRFGPVTIAQNPTSSAMICAIHGLS